MKGKRGQFYIVTIIIIISLAVGFFVVSNYAKRRADVKLYDIKEELGIESGNVLDYGIYNELDDQEMRELLEDFVSEYEEYAGEGKNLYFIFGNTQTITVIVYQDLIEEEAYIGGVEGGEQLLIIGGESQQFSPEGNNVEITIDEDKYKFNLNQGENFYFVIRQESEGEKHVITGSEVSE